MLVIRARHHKAAPGAEPAGRRRGLLRGGCASHGRYGVGPEEVEARPKLFAKNNFKRLEKWRGILRYERTNPLQLPRDELTARVSLLYQQVPPGNKEPFKARLPWPVASFQTFGTTSPPGWT